MVDPSLTDPGLRDPADIIMDAEEYVVVPVTMFEHLDDELTRLEDGTGVEAPDFAFIHEMVADAAAATPLREVLDAAAQPPPTHRHFKGGLYTLIGYGRHSETEEEMAFYRSADGRLWARPRAMFDDGRFAPLDRGR